MYGIFESSQESKKHRVFISYYHHDDEYYRNRFEDLFGHLFINTSVKPGDIDTDLSTEYIKRLIQQGYISGSSVVLVLVGPKTYCRKHVDWEISAGLNKKVGGYSGLLGLCLPNHPNYNNDKYNPNIVPARLVDNLKTEYANFYDWTENESNIKKWIGAAFNQRITDKDRIDNSRLQMQRNTCE
ncbi:MAG: TIR domain-containing protein [Candidatus Helarchaeota archaeon]